MTKHHLAKVAVRSHPQPEPIDPAEVPATAITLDLYGDEITGNTFNIEAPLGEASFTITSTPTPENSDSTYTITSSDESVMKLNTTDYTGWSEGTSGVYNITFDTFKAGSSLVTIKCGNVTKKITFVYTIEE